jgi:hypothetical protein
MNWDFTGSGKSLKPRLGYLPGSVPRRGFTLAGLAPLRGLFSNPLRRFSPSCNHATQCGNVIIGQMTPFA